MYLGEYRQKFSGHGRLVLPKKFRVELKGEKGIILSRGMDGCIWGFDQNRWQEETAKQLKQSLSDKEARDLRRYTFSAAETVRLDEQGRFVIPNALLQYANLENAAVIIGTGDHFEIWNEQSWNKLKIILEKRVGNG